MKVSRKASALPGAKCEQEVKREETERKHRWWVFTKKTIEIM